MTAVTSPAQAQTASTTTLDIGDQQGITRSVLEASGQLDHVNYTIRWHEFTNAAPLIEALMANRLDAGTVGDAPLTFASAKPGFNVRGIFATRYFGNALIVSGKQNVSSVKQLAGQRIATVPGSAGHAMTLAALRKAGVPFDAVHFVNLSPADAATALAGGSVDGVATWEPYVSFAVLKHGARIVVDGKDYPSLAFFVATTDAIRDKRAALADLVTRLAAAREWGTTHRAVYAKLIERIVRIPPDVALADATREVNSPTAITPEVIGRLQQTIDLYADAGLIKTKGDAKAVLDTSFAIKR